SPGKLPGDRILYKKQPAHVPAFYMASCHVAMEYRLRFHSQGSGRIFLTENLHPAFGSLTAPPSAV
ncbi:hypothetical protein, partial [[Clostridium] innocuum]